MSDIQIECCLTDKIQIFICKVLKKLHLNSFTKRFFGGFCKKTLNVDTELAREYLNSVSAKPLGSSYVERKIDWNTDKPFDLQVIVPAYNAEKYINECIDSLLIQCSKYSWQAIIINDGSTDSTLQLLNKYKNDARIRIVTQENRGFSGSRNKGLEMIGANYVMFVDSDDLLEPGAIDNLLDKAYSDNYDIVEGNYYRLINKKKKQSSWHIDRELNDPIGQLSGFPWGKVIKSSLFRNIQFPEGYWYEDSIFSFLIYPLCKKTATIKKMVYCYRYNPKGISVSSRGKAKCIDTYWILEDLFDSMKRLDICQTDIADLFLRHCLFSYNRVEYLNKEIRKSIFVLLCDCYAREFQESCSLTEDRRFSFLREKIFSLYELNGRLY